MQLAEIDEALLAFSSGDNRRVSDKPSASTAARWFDAVTTALQTPVEAPDYPGAPVRACNARTSRRAVDARARRTGGCSPRSPGAAPRSIA